VFHLKSNGVNIYILY